MRKFYLLFFAALYFAAHTVAQPVLLSESFEGTAFPPAGWTLTNAGTGNSWVRESAPAVTAYDGTKSMGYEYNASAANAWAFTPALALNGQQVTVTFFVRTLLASSHERMKFTVGNANTPAAQTTVLLDSNDISNHDFRQWKATFTPAAAGTYTFAFNCYSAASGNYLIVDSVTIRQAPAAIPACPANLLPLNGAINIPFKTNVALSWNAVADAEGYDVYFGNTNPPFTKISSTDLTTISVGSLLPATKYYWYAIAKNSLGTSVSCSTKITSFTTAARPQNDSCGAPAVLAEGNVVFGTTIDATQSIPPEICGSSTSNDPSTDVWYSINTPAGGPLNLLVAPDVDFNPVVAAYAGSCGSLTRLTCVNSGSAGIAEIVNINVVPGTYLVRVYGYYESTESGNGEGTFSIVATGSALPVDLANLRGYRNGQYNQLEWSTKSETNNTGFNVERSMDGASFASLEFVPSKAANGNSVRPLDYAYTDTRVNGSAWYRLKQVNKDGSASYSNTILVNSKRSAGNLQLTTLWPNPAGPFTQVGLESNAVQIVRMRIIDREGRTCAELKQTLNAGANPIRIKTAALPAGVYMLDVATENGAGRFAAKLMKL